MNGVLVLEDGHFFTGERFGSTSNDGGEVVFNTSLTGYQEILTDPSYAGQVVTLTYPHIGNYGINPGDLESAQVQVAALVVRDQSPTPSNWRSEKSLNDWLAETGTPGLCGVDTRALVLHLRENGALRGVIRDLPAELDLPLAGDASELSDSSASLLQGLVAEAAAIPSMSGLDLAQRVTCAQPYEMGDADAPWHVAVLDLGVKRNILRQLVQVGCRVTVLPAQTTAQAIRDLAPDGLMLSNGPGDPEPVTYAIETIRDLLGELPIFGICLGHQLLALSCGARTYKLPFGHRGSNHPVRDLSSSRVEITAQNHGFAVDAGSLPGSGLTLTHLHLNDDTVAGLRHRIHSAFSVQFHPEASPGPHDSHHLFTRFIDEMDKSARVAKRSYGQEAS